jgi:hypothetical protein
MSYNYLDPEGNTIVRFHDRSNTFNLNDNSYSLIPSNTTLTLLSGYPAYHITNPDNFFPSISIPQNYLPYSAFIDGATHSYGKITVGADTFVRDTLSYVSKTTLVYPSLPVNYQNLKNNWITSNQPYGNGLYQVNVSSTSSSYGYEPFDNSATTAWASKGLMYNMTSGTYLGSSNLDGTYVGEWLTLTLPYPVAIQRYDLTWYNLNAGSSPRKFKFYGSNTITSVWNELDSRSNQSFTVSVPNSYSITNGTRYTKYGFVFNEVNAVDNGASSTYVNLADCKLYETGSFGSSFYSSNLNINTCVMPNFNDTNIRNISPNSLIGTLAASSNLTIPLKVAHGRRYLDNVSLTTSTTTLQVYSISTDTQSYITMNAGTKIMLNYDFQGQRSTAGTAQYDMVLRTSGSVDYTIDSIYAVVTTVNINRHYFKSIVYTLPATLNVAEIRISAVSGTFTTSTTNLCGLQIFHYT